MKILAHTINEDCDIILDGVNISKDLDKVSDERLDELLEISERYAMVNMSLSIAQKTMMNSMYGAMANAFYYFASIDAASDITAEGRFYIKSANEIINKYFIEDWHNDHETHKLLWEHPDLKDSFAKHEVTPMKAEDYVMYIDTDSMYVCFAELFESCNFDPTKHGKYAEFIMYFNEIKLRKLFVDELGALIAKRHGENYLKFDLESISDTAMFIKKKKYVMAYKMDGDRVYDDPTKHIKGKGVEIIQSTMSTPVKEMLKFLIVQLFNGNITNQSYRKYIHFAYEKFKSLPITDRCSIKGVNGYADYVINDTTGLEFKKGADAAIKGMALHNYKIKSQNLGTQYEIIKGGKIAWYYTKDGGSFAYAIGEFPEDIAEPIDDDAQFTKLVLKPFSRMVEVTDIDTSNPFAKHMTAEL